MWHDFGSAQAWDTISSCWRRDREAEGAPLLREYAVKSCIKGSNPFVSAICMLHRVLPVHFFCSAPTQPFLAFLAFFAVIMSAPHAITSVILRDWKALTVQGLVAAILIPAIIGCYSLGQRPLPEDKLQQIRLACEDFTRHRATDSLYGCAFLDNDKATIDDKATFNDLKRAKGRTMIITRAMEPAALVNADGELQALRPDSMKVFEYRVLHTISDGAWAMAVMKNRIKRSDTMQEL